MLDRESEAGEYLMLFQTLKSLQNIKVMTVYFNTMSSMFIVQIPVLYFS